MDFKVDFIGIGTHKSGSTTISHFLEAHPQICLSIPNQIKYFNHYESYWHKQKENQNFGKPIGWYAKHFNHSKRSQIKGEFSNAYFIDEAAPRLIYTKFPDVKLIIILRDPVKRAYSEYQMVKNMMKRESRDFHKLLKEENEVIERGFYYKHIMRYREFFNANQIKLILHDDLKTDPVKTASELYDFLQVDSNFEPKNVRKKSNSARIASSKLYYSLHHFSKKVSNAGGGFFINLLRKSGINRQILSFLSKPNPYESMNETEERFLKDIYRKDIEKLEILLQRDLSSWK